MNNQPKNELGKRGEALAASYLKNIGYTILDRNWEGKTGEVDLVAMDEDTVVFVEVKTRSNENYGTPKDAVNTNKRRHMTSVAKEYLKKNIKQEKPVRFDVVAVSIKGNTLFERLRSPKIEHIKSAFEVKE